MQRHNPSQGNEARERKADRRRGLQHRRHEGRLRSTIIVDNSTEAQKVLDAIVSMFELTRKPKNRAGATELTVRGEQIAPENPAKYGGYTDVLAKVRMPNGVIAEIQINVPEMLSAKDGPGHKLYEAYRDAPKESQLGQEILAEMLGYYAAAADAFARRASTSAKNSDSERSYHSDSGPRESISGQGRSASPESTSRNHLPSGNSTKNPPSTRSPNREPAGNLPGSFIDTPSTGSLAGLVENAHTVKQGGQQHDATTNRGAGDQGQGAQTAPRTRGGRDAGRVRRRAEGPDLFGDGEPDDGRSSAREVGQPRTGRVRAPDEGGRSGKSGDRDGRRAGVPAGRDIAPKSGLNFSFGDGDLTYEGSWAKKAEANVVAVELLKKLQAEPRQTTRDEQRMVAKFVGWGSGELANNLFSKKLDEQAQALTLYDDAIENQGDRPRLSKASTGCYTAIRVLQAGDLGLGWYGVENITKAMLDEAKPPANVHTWIALRNRRKAVMSEQGWAEAARSTQYAHYTSKAVVQSMWQAIDRLGFKGGVILESGAGIGVHRGLMPEAIANKRLRDVHRKQ